jgi:hypothetical protein
MGLIRTPNGGPDRHTELQGQPGEDMTPAELKPFSHDSYFSVSARSTQGYRLQTIEKIIVIGGNGQIVAVEEPERLVGTRRSRGAMLAPTAATPDSHVPLRFLWGPVRSVLGLSEARPGTAGSERVMEDHSKYKALHHRVLDGVGDIALQAFLRFLERQTPSAASEFPTIVERPRCKLAFRFQYDEHYLHERHAAQLAWKRFLTPRYGDR